MAVRREAQLDFDTEVIDDEVLEEMLVEWQRAKDTLQPYREEYDTQDKRVKGEIETRELEPGTYRVGAFLVTIREHESREVSFTRKSSRSMHIKRAGE